MNILSNNTIQRKSSFIPSIIHDDKNILDDNEQISSITFDDLYKNNHFFNYDTLGLYLRYKNKSNNIENKTIIINSLNRNILLYKDPLNFTIKCTDILPNIYSINLKKTILPKIFGLSKNIQTINPLFSTIINYLLTNILLLNNNKSFLIPSSNASIVTIVNYVPTNKINFILNYDTLNIYNYDLSTSILYLITYDSGFNISKYKYINVSINCFNDNYQYNTEQKDNYTFQLIPKSSKKYFIHLHTKNIQKYFYKNPKNINYINIKFDNININNLDYDVPFIKNCTCSDIDENKNYSCYCNYILHPLHKYYQSFFYLTFETLHPHINNINESFDHKI